MGPGHTARGSRLGAQRAHLRSHCAWRPFRPKTRTRAALLGPCFKTGPMGHSRKPAPTARIVTARPHTSNRAQPTLQAVQATTGQHTDAVQPYGPAPPRRKVATLLGLPRAAHQGASTEAGGAPANCPRGNTNPTHQTGADPAPAPLQQVPGGPNPGGSIPPGGQSNSHQSGPTATPVGTGTPQRPMGFPSSGFTHCLTLFSKCFSPFPHGTCLLSVSHQYSALDGVYHPLWAALPNNPTLRGGLTQAARRGPRRRGYHPLRRALPRRL